jgi:putative hemolysin
LDPDDWQHFVFAILALLAVIASGIALTVLGQVTNQRLAPETADHSRGHRLTRSLVNTRRAMASAMLFIQIIAAVVASAQVTHLVDRSTDRDMSWLAILMVAVIYIVFGLALPRAIAGKQLDRLVDAVLKIGRGVTRLLTPVDWVVERLAGFFRILIPGPVAVHDTFGVEDELRGSRFSSDDGMIGEDERQMIDGILSLEEMTVRDIMVPRLDIVALDRAVKAQDMIDTITKAGHSRIPVYQESIDRILGVLYVKDLLPFVIGNTIRIPLLDLIRPAFVVPESKKLSELFTELKRTKIHMAIVADEYGGTAGLVTIEDILEEIVGEIQDEYDTETPLFEIGAEGALIADGRLPIEDVEDALKVDFEEDDDFGTLGGFVHKHLGRLPIQGDTFEAEGVRVQILAVERHRVRKLRITKLERPAEEVPEESKERGERWRWRDDSGEETATPPDEPT